MLLLRARVWCGAAYFYGVFCVGILRMLVMQRVDCSMASALCSSVSIVLLACWCFRSKKQYRVFAVLHLWPVIESCAFTAGILRAARCGSH